MDSEHREGRRDVSKEAFWRQVVVEAAGSGLSLREFCRQRGLKEMQFYAWRRELKLRDVEKQCPKGFVELLGAGDASARRAGVSVRVSERLSIMLEPGFDVPTLRATLDCLGVNITVAPAAGAAHG